MTINHEALVARIMARCIEDGGCLMWTGALARSGSLPQISAQRKTLSVRRIMFQATIGEIAPKHVICTSCGSPRCLRHLEQRTQLDQKRAAAVKGAYGGAVRTLKMAATKRAKSAISEALVQQIRSADESSRELSRALGVSASHVRAIRSGKARAPLASPFARLGAR